MKPTYYVKSYHIVLTVYCRVLIHRMWPLNILDYRPVVDVKGLNVIQKEWAILKVGNILNIARLRAT